MTPDRPTGPATFTPRVPSVEDSAPGMVWSTTLSPAEFTQALEDARTAERDRILAALPEALRQAMEPYALSHDDFDFYPEDDPAAALAVAIEKILEDKE